MLAGSPLAQKVRHGAQRKWNNLRLQFLNIDEGFQDEVAGSAAHFRGERRGERQGGREAQSSAGQQNPDQAQHHGEGSPLPSLDWVPLAPGFLLYVLWCKEVINTSPQICLN